MTTSQKAQLALIVFVIYWPIRLYMNIDAISWLFLTKVWPLWIIEIPLTIFFFFCWISLAQWLITRFDRWSNAFLSVWTQFGLLILASGIAVLFNFVFHVIRAELTRATNAPTPVSEQQQTQAEIANIEKRGGWPLRQRMNNGITVMAMLSAFHLVVNRRSSSRMRALEVEAERMQKETAEAQFMALKNQVNPHFLFNSLSILASLVEVDAKLSVQFINQLSKAYRYILEQRDNERVSLKTELDFIQAYLFLLRIRFNDKLQVKIDIPEANVARFAIAPLTLQILIENAVKHNRMSAQEPLTVSIYCENDSLFVTNPMQSRPVSEPSTGLGLQNITNRYALLTDRPVWVGEREGEFIVKIPLL